MFTHKQIRIIELLTEGEDNYCIARELETTSNVIRNCLREIYDMTGMFTRLELALWWLAREKDYKCSPTKYLREKSSTRRVPLSQSDTAGNRNAKMTPPHAHSTTRGLS